MKMSETNAKWQARISEKARENRPLYTQAQMDAALTDIWTEVEHILTESEFGDFKAMWSSRKGFWASPDGAEGYDLTHWMPLPTPPSVFPLESGEKSRDEKGPEK